MIAAVALVGALTAWLGAREAAVPPAVAGGEATIPLWRMLAMGAAVLPILALHSPLVDLEAVTTRRLRQHQRAYLCAMSLGGATLYLGICAVTLSPLVLVIMARSWLAWSGLALVAGALLGWRLAWTLPATMTIVLAYWGLLGVDRYRWWEFSARPHDDLPSLALSVGLLLAGCAAYSATPWRRRRWLRRAPPSKPTAVRSPAGRPVRPGPGDNDGPVIDSGGG